MNHYLKKAAALVVAAPAYAMAALPTGVEAAITTTTTDGVALVGLMAVAGGAIYLIWKVLKRAGLSL